MAKNKAKKPQRAPGVKKIGNFLGKIPKVLNELTEAEIREAGEKNYDEMTFLISKGMVDPALRAKTITFPKWVNNYSVGKAKFLLKLMDKLRESADGGDTQILKQIANANLNIQPIERKEENKVIVIGAPK